MVLGYTYVALEPFRKISMYDYQSIFVIDWVHL